MFDIVYSLLFDFIDFLKWFIPMLIIIGCVGEIARQGGKI